MPPWPIAIPSSTAIVLNSSGTPPALCTAALTTSPTGFRWVWPGTNCVYELATATIGLPKSSRATPAARRSARAPAMLRPWVTVRDLSPGMQGTLAEGRRVAFPAPAAQPRAADSPLARRVHAPRAEMGARFELDAPRSSLGRPRAPGTMGPNDQLLG